MWSPTRIGSIEVACNMKIWIAEEDATHRAQCTHSKVGSQLMNLLGSVWIIRICNVPRMPNSHLLQKVKLCDHFLMQIGVWSKLGSDKPRELKIIPSHVYIFSTIIEWYPLTCSLLYFNIQINDALEAIESTSYKMQRAIYGQVDKWYERHKHSSKHRQWFLQQSVIK